jgi:hypothetical protein
MCKKMINLHLGVQLLAAQPHSVMKAVLTITNAQFVINIIVWVADVSIIKE